MISSSPSYMRVRSLLSWTPGRSKRLSLNTGMVYWIVVHHRCYSKGHHSNVRVKPTLASACHAPRKLCCACLVNFACLRFILRASSMVPGGQTWQYLQSIPSEQPPLYRKPHGVHKPRLWLAEPTEGKPWFGVSISKTLLSVSAVLASDVVSNSIISGLEVSSLVRRNNSLGVHMGVRGVPKEHSCFSSRSNEGKPSSIKSTAPSCIFVNSA
mmetsp:Transcript_25822/g.40827  ORF Transcript_25822/g.40827 Transcript_25822/m.40827 type:complete len:212 (+) Transcript_25822:334-969(+)